MPINLWDIIHYMSTNTTLANSYFRKAFEGYKSLADNEKDARAQFEVGAFYRMGREQKRILNLLLNITNYQQTKDTLNLIF